MDTYKIEGDGKKPNVSLNGEKGLIEISGRSIPEHAGKVYQSILDWIGEYVQSPAEQTVIDYKMEYYNSSSKRYLLEVLECFNPLHQNGHKVTFNWYYEENDEDEEDVGILFRELIEYETNLIEVPEED